MDKDETREQLINELSELRQRVAELEAAETGRKRAEEALRQSEGRLQSLFETMAEGMVLIAPDGQIVQANRAAERILGLRRSEIEGRNYVGPEWEIIRPDGAPMPPQEMAGPRAMKEKHPVKDVVMGVKRQNGSFSWINVSATPLVDEAGKLEGVVGTFVDITGRKRGEEVLRESEERYRQAVENSPNPIFSVGNEGIVQTWNRACEQIFQYGSEEIVGQAYHKLLWNPKDRPAVEAMLAQVWQGRSLSGQDMTYRCKDGTQRFTVSRLYPLRGHQRGVEGCVFANTDITERRRAEEALEQRAAQLALLNDVGEKIAAVLELDSVLDRAVRLVQEGFDYHHVALFTLGDEQGELVMRARAGAFTDLFPPDHRLKLDQGMVGWAGRHGQSLLVNDVDAEPRYVNLYPDVIPTRSELSVPIRVAGEVVGVLDVQSPQPNAFDENDVMVIETLANQMAVAIENARLFEAEQRRRQEAEALRKASLVLGSMLDVSQMLDQLLEQIGRVIPYDSANVILIEAGMARVAHWRGDERFGTAEAAAALRLQVEQMPHLRRMFVTHCPQIIPDTRADPEWVHLETSSWVCAWVGAPIVVWGEVIGFFSLNSETPGSYSLEQAELLRAFAVQAAVAIENAQLVEGLEVQVAARTAEIRAEQEKSEAILRSVGDAIVVIDLEGKIQYVNDAFTALTGYTAEEALGQQVSALIGERVSEQAHQSLQFAWAKGEAWQGEVTHRRKDGRAYEAALTTAPMRDAEGHLVGYVSSHRDISQRKELERARSRFMANVSHQLRTPVANLKLYVHLLRKAHQPERTEHYLRVLDEQGTRLGDLVQDVLEITELDSGQAVMTWQPVSLPTVIRDTVTRYQSRAEASGLTLVAMSVPPDLPAVRGDQVRLYQALSELAENAIVFTPAGGKVTIEARDVEQEGQRWVTVAVRDTGPGIPPEEQERIFDRFFRGSLVEAGHIPGTGLGLAIAKEIVDSHGGKIEVESEVGRGSTFTLWLRLGSAPPL